MKPVNQTLKQKVHDIMKTELNQILDNLKGENFFNLCGNPIDINVIENLKSGKKFTPFCTFSIKKELAKFENKTNDMLDRIFGNQPFKTNSLKNNPELYRLLHYYSQQKKDAKSRETIFLNSKCIKKTLQPSKIKSVHFN